MERDPEIPTGGRGNKTPKQLMNMPRGQIRPLAGTALQSERPYSLVARVGRALRVGGAPGGFRFAPIEGCSLARSRRNIDTDISCFTQGPWRSTQLRTARRLQYLCLAPSESGFLFSWRRFTCRGTPFRVQVSSVTDKDFPVRLVALFSHEPVGALATLKSEHRFGLLRSPERHEIFAKLSIPSIW